MNYDLSIKDDRLRFIKYANDLLNKQRSRIILADESDRTLKQNAYIHLLFRIVADYTGDTEEYVKQVHFKQLVNPDIFVKITKDKTTNQMIRYILSSAEVSIKDMSKAIKNFILWAAEHKIELPQAEINDDYTVTFASQQDANMYHQAERLLDE